MPPRVAFPGGQGGAPPVRQRSHSNQPGAGMRKMIVVFAFTGFVLPLGFAYAQGRAMEVGAAVGMFSYASGGGTHVFSFQTAGSGIYLGIPIRERLAIEPSVSIAFARVDGANLLVAGLGLGVSISFEGVRRGMFFAPFGALRFVNAGASGVGDSDVQFGIGASFGAKTRLADRVSLRTEFPVQYSFESSHFPGTFTIGGQLGVALFFGGH